MAFRAERIAEIIKSEVGKEIQKWVEFPAGVLVTITRVEVGFKLDYAKIFVSVLPDANANQALEILKKNIYHIQKQLDRSMRTRPVPQIIFKIDEAPREAFKVEKILEEIKEKESH